MKSFPEFLRSSSVVQGIILICKGHFYNEYSNTLDDVDFVE